MLGRKILPLVLAVAPVGCGATRSESSGLGAGDGGGGSASEGGSRDAGRDGPFVEAHHLAFPQEVWQGGAVLTAPKVVSVTFPGDSMASALDQFGQSVASSTWWDSVRTGYCAGKGGPCVGDGPAGVSAPLTTAPAAAYTDAQLQTWLEGEITTHALPAPDSAPVTQTIYVLYFPQSTTITDSTGTASCSGFDGYHGSMTMGSQQVVYAVVNECPQYALTDLTLSASHEIIEAATDPSNLVTAYYLDTSSPDTWGWDDVFGGEVADMCADQLGLGQTARATGLSPPSAPGRIPRQPGEATRAPPFPPAACTSTRRRSRRSSCSTSAAASPSRPTRSRPPLRATGRFRLRTGRAAPPPISPSRSRVAPTAAQGRS